EEPEPKVEVPAEKIITAKVELEGPKTIGKIDLDKLNTPKPKPAESEKPVVQEEKKPIKEEPKPEVKEEVKPEPVVEKVIEKVEEPVKPAAPATEPVVEKPEAESEEPKKIETKYQKLEGPNFTGKKLDLSEFEKDKKLAEDRKEKQKQEKENKKKRKRIRKDVKLDDVKPSDN